MTYNVYGGTLSLTQSITPKPVPEDASGYKNSRDPHLAWYRKAIKTAIKRRRISAEYFSLS